MSPVGGAGRIYFHYYLYLLCITVQLGIPTHEIGHAIGLYHEQSRPDRFTYVSVLTSNIDPMSVFNFIVMDPSLISTYNIPYDYGSVMHYSSQVRP